MERLSQDPISLLQEQVGPYYRVPVAECIGSHKRIMMSIQNEWNEHFRYRRNTPPYMSPEQWTLSALRNFVVEYPEYSGTLDQLYAAYGQLLDAPNEVESCREAIEGLLQEFRVHDRTDQGVMGALRLMPDVWFAEQGTVGSMLRDVLPMPERPKPGDYLIQSAAADQ